MTDDSDLIWQQKLEELRRSSQISIDRQGRWWHEKVSFEHPRILAVLNAGLSWTMTDESSEVIEIQRCFEGWVGDATVQLGSQWCYVDCDLTPFLVMSLRIDPQVNSIVALLNNHERWPLRFMALHDDVLFTRLAYDRLARFSVEAQSQCSQWLIQDQDETFALEWGGQRWVIQDSFSTST